MNSQIDQPQEVDITVHTFRFKFSQEFTEQMANFAKIHQYDDRKAFKEAWQEWIKDDDMDNAEFANEIFCNIDKDCFYNRNNEICETIENSATRMKRIAKKSLESKTHKF